MPNEPTLETPEAPAVDRAAPGSALVALAMQWEAERDNLARDFGDDDQAVDVLRRCARELRDAMQEELARKDLLDWAESLICNAVPMPHCTQEEWDAAVKSWRDQIHGVKENNRPDGLGVPGTQLQDRCPEPVILDNFGCHKQVAQWMEAGKYRTLVHRHDGTFVAADESEQKCVRADTLPLLADSLMNWPEHADPLPPSMWVKVPAVQNDPSSATRPTRTLDCNSDAMAGFAAAHG